MERQEHVSRLKAMLEQVAPGGDLERVSRPSPGGLLEGFAGGGEDPSASAASGLQKFQEDREHEMSAAEIRTLEAIVLPKERPVVFVRGGLYDDIEAPWEHLNNPTVKAQFQPLLSAIGRIDLPGAPFLPFGGTGFIVGRNLVMTNRHVAAIVAQGLGTRLHYQAGDAAVDFKHEVETAETDHSASFVVRSIVMIHPFWDMALLQTEGLDAIPPLRLSVKPPEALFGREVLTVGYPARDDRNDLDLQDQIFRKKYNVKRVQPGKLVNRTVVRSFENRVNALTHNSSTLGGNSGSAIIDIASRQVVALHFAGEYLKANYGVPTFELARDSRVSKLNLNFDGSAPFTTEFDAAWRFAEGGESISSTPPVQSSGGAAPPAGATPVPTSAAVTTPSVQADGSVTFTIPLRISVSLGQPDSGAGISSAPSPSAALVESTMAVPKIFGGLEHRKGYQPDFLDLDDDEAPLPELTNLGGQIVAKLEDGSHEIKYHKFSVVMHKGRRIALFTASNVDWRESSRLIDGHKPTRKELTGIPDGAIEKWVTDWRIPEAHQLPDTFFTNDNGAFDKGHLVRRDDVAWGKPFADMQKANGDTYHTTNCSPQTAAFNRPKPSDDINNWGDLEDLVQKQTKADRAIIFAGPVFEDDDPLFDGRDSQGKTLVRIPRRFWKIVVVKGAAGPEAYGFALTQDLTGVRAAEEFVVPIKFRREMKSIPEIEEMLHGLALLTWLKKHDQFESREGVQMASAIA